MRRNNRKKPVVMGRASSIRVPSQYFGELYPWFDLGHCDSIRDFPMRARREIPGMVEWEAYTTGYNMHKNRPFEKRLKKTQQLWNEDLDRAWLERLVEDLFDALDAPYRKHPARVKES